MQFLSAQKPIHTLLLTFLAYLPHPYQVALLQSEGDSGLGIFLVLIGCLCGITALIAAVVVVILLVKKGKVSSSYKSVFNEADDHFSVMDD